MTYGARGHAALQEPTVHVRCAPPGPIARVTARLEHWLSGMPTLVALYARAYSEVIEKEISLAGITGEDRVLNVGCGAAPFTALLLARHTGATVICLDRDREAVARAQRLIRREGLDESVRVIAGDAVHCTPDFDVAVIALQTTPKLRVLQRLAQNSAPAARLVVRQSADWCRAMYDQLPSNLAPRAEVHHHRGAFERSVLFRASDLREASREGS